MKLTVIFLSAALALGSDSVLGADDPAKAQAKNLTTGGKWPAGSMDRPRPVVVTPPTASTPEKAGTVPSDAVVLFDGKDLSAWEGRAKGKNEAIPAPWKVENGYFEIVPGTGQIQTKQKFADCQIHIEWATPAEVKGNSQGRGNSGFFISGHPEVQVLDSYDNDTYPDGQAAALYHLFPPLVNASRKPGEWQSYDIVYDAPLFDEQKKMIRPARYTVFHNGILVHHAVEVPGNAVECPFSLQDHGNPIRFRNIWVRPLKGYDGKPIR